MSGDNEGGFERTVERYEAILDTVDDIVFIVDERRRVEYANESALEYAETTREELYGTPVMALAERMVVGEGVERFEAALDAAFDGDGEFPMTVELELDLPGGRTVGEYRLSPSDDGGGVVVVARDITDRKRREQRLRTLTEEYETIFENAQDAVFLIDVDTEGPEAEFRVDRFNPAYEAITGLTTEEARGKTPREILGEERGAEVEANYRRCVEAAEPVTYQEELPMPEGRITTRTSLAPVVVDGEVTQIVGSARDITERAQQAAELERRDQQLRRLHDATRKLLGAETAERAAEIASDAADDILELPLNGVHFYDEAADALVPVAVSEASRELLSESPPALDRGVAWESFREGEPRIDTDVREAENVYNPETPMRSEMHLPLGGHGVFIVSSPEVDAFDETDVELARTLAANTEAALRRIAREEELRTREAELLERNERLDEFASVASHDLRNPLNVASGRLELAREDCDSEHLDAVAEAHERMDALIDDLLALARQGTSVDDIEAVDLAGMVENCWRNVPTADASYTVETRGTVRADRSRLQQLLENLFRNAVKHGSGSVTVTVGDLDGGFYVADDGPGIPPEEREAVFDVGYSTGEEGSGVGLSIVDRIVTAHGWEIAVTESAGGGARFEITGVDRVDG